MSKSPESNRRAFTLTELLVVMGIIVLMGALIVPAVSGSLKGSAMNQAAQMILSQLNGAQQLALARGQTIEVRLFFTADPESPNADTISLGDEDDSQQNSGRGDQGYFRAIQSYTISPNLNANPSSNGDDRQVYAPASKLEFLPNSVIVDKGTGSPGNVPDNTLTSLKSTAKFYSKTPASRFPKLPRIGTNYRYFAIQFRPDSSTDLDQIYPSFLTIHYLTDRDRLTQPPKNFFTVSIDPVQGSTRIFRP